MFISANLRFDQYWTLVFISVDRIKYVNTMLVLDMNISVFAFIIPISWFVRENLVICVILVISALVPGGLVVQLRKHLVLS